MIQRILDSGESTARQPLSLDLSSVQDTAKTVVEVQPAATPVRSSWTGVIPSIVLVGVDVIAMSAALAFVAEFGTTAGLPAPVLTWVVAVGLLVLAMAVSSGYGAGAPASPGALVPKVAGAVSFAVMGLAAMLMLQSDGNQAAGRAIPLWATALLLVPAGRVAAVPILSLLRRYDIGTRQIIVVGTHPEAAAAARALEARRGAYTVAGIIELRTSEGVNPLQRHEANGTSVNGYQDSVAMLAGLGPRQEVLVAAPPAHIHEVESALRRTLPEETPVYVDLPTLLGGPSTGSLKAFSNGMPAVRVRTRYESWQYCVAKRTMDVAIALPALLLAAPVMLMMALVIKLDSPGGIIFQQTRVGRRGQTFFMYKFRSMRQDAEAVLEELTTSNEAKGALFKIKDDPRLTRVGRIIRRLSLDELPQLINVLQGSMSIVGPRPPLPREVMTYEPWQLRRLDLTPGITGLWQVGRSDDSSFDEMVRMDLEYIDHWSLALDIQVLLRTLPAMVMARGAY